MKKITAFLISGFIVLNAAAQDEATLVKVGDAAPGFSITMEDGTTKTLAGLKGKVVWINFFATWCPPCRKELPHLEKGVFEKYKNRNDFEVMVIGREHSWEEINKFKTGNKYRLPFYPDPERKIFAAYATQNIPRNFIIDKEGKIAVASVGYKEEEFNQILKKVVELLKN